MMNRPKLINLALVLAILFGAMGFIPQPVTAATSDLFFSEYVEGSSNNKALEIYNGTGAAVDLTVGDYEIKFYFNGGTSAGATIDLMGTIANGDVFVVADDGAVLGLTPDQTSSGNFFNGDDAIELLKSGVVIDSIGQIGVDPGSQWGSGDTSTQDNTLRRKESVCEGDSDSSDAFDPTGEWVGFAQDTFDGLGSHTADCDVVSEPVINEIRIDQPSTDNDEYFELIGAVGMSLDGLTYLVIGDGSGGSGVIENVNDLTGQAIPSSGYFVAAEDTFTLGTADMTTDLNFENSDNVTHLLVRGFTGADGEDLDTDDDGTLDSTPWSELVDCVGLVKDLTSGEKLYCETLVGPDGSFVPSHVYRCEDGWRIGDYETGTTDSPGAANICTPPIPEVVINEIMQNPDAVSDANGEWLELYNPSDTSIDINGWTLADNGADSHLIDHGSPLEIPAGGYLILGNNSDQATNGGVVVDYSYGSNWFLSNSDDEVVLIDAASNEIDRVEYDGGPIFPDPTGASMSLSDPALDNNDGANWCTSITQYGDGDLGTPGAANICTPPALELVINEIMQNPDAVSDANGEWLELYNPSDTSIDINGWTLADNGSDNHLIDNGGPLLIPAGGYLVLGNNLDELTNGGVTVDYSYGSNWFLSNSDDEVVLIDAASNEIDRVEYDGGPTFPDPTGASMSLIDPALDNNIGANWCTSITQYGDGDLGTPGVANICTPPAPEILINEVDSDTPGTDELEFIELYDGGSGNTALDGLVVVFYNGNGDTSYAAYDLDGFSTDVNGYFLLGNADVDPTPSIVFSNNGLQNGADAVALYEGDASDFPNGTEVTTENLLDSLVYDTDDADDAGLLDLLNAGQPQVNEAAGTGSAVDSNQRCPNGSGGLRNTDTYTQFIPTPGSENCTLPPEACGDDYTPIYEIQGSGFSTPLSGTNLATEGIVVGDFQTGGKNGFYIQAMIGDDDQATSDGIFVYAPGAIDVTMGDHVRVRGTATEYFDLTQVGSVSQVWLCEAGLDLPAPTEFALPVADLQDFERLEGMLVTIPQDLVIAEYFNFGRYGEIMLSSERFMTFTAANEPDVAGFASSEETYKLSSITLDDGRTSQNPDPAIHPNGSEFTMDRLFRGGDLVANVTGIMDYSFSLYRIQPTQGADYTPVNPRPETLTFEEDTLIIASFNVLNFFITLDDGPDICGPSGDMECRGADTADELIRQRDKILAAMSEIDADVFGLMEIENDSPLGAGDAVADLVAGLNDIAGPGTYDYIATGAIGTDAIKVALLYKPASVTPVGDYAILDSTVDPRFIDTKNRPTLAQIFEDNLTGETFTVAVNHLKSKGSDCNDLFDPDLGDGAGNCNITRLNAAEAMVDWLADETIFSEVDNVLIIGDLNSYDKEDPIDAIKLGADDTQSTDDDYFDMIYEILGEDAYGYVFDGKTGYLDYAIASTAIKDNILDVALWHINADEPSLIDYDMSFKQDAQDALYAPDKYRSSDHDPVIISLRLNEGPTAVDDVYETDQDVTLNVSEPGVMENDSDPNPNDELWVDIKTGPSHGELTLNDDGSFTYIPDPGFFGVDTFEYYLLALPPEMRSDYMDIGLVTITVRPKYQFFVPFVVND